MSHPFVREVAVDGIPVAVTCRVLKLARQPFYRSLAGHGSGTAPGLPCHADDACRGHRVCRHRQQPSSSPTAVRGAICISATSGPATSRQRRVDQPAATCTRTMFNESKVQVPTTSSRDVVARREQ